MARLNLALIVRTAGTNGGTEKYTSDLASWLVERGHRVSLLCSEGVAPNGVGVIPVSPSVIGGLVGRAAFGRRVAAVDLSAFDAVESMGRWPVIGIHRAGGGSHRAWLTARGGRVRWRDRLELWMEQRAFSAAVRIVANSRMAAADIARDCPAFKRKILVIENGIQLERFVPDPVRRAEKRSSMQVSDKARVVAFLGHGFARKGLSTAVAAFQQMACSTDELWVIGNGERPAFATGPQIRWLGSVPHPEHWLPAVDATILPTLYDSAANTTLESMACGVPPVVSARDGNHDRVPDRRLVVQHPDDISGFATALDYALQNRDLRDQVRVAAEAWPVSRNGEAMEQLFEEVKNG